MTKTTKILLGGILALGIVVPIYLKFESKQQRARYEAEIASLRKTQSELQKDKQAFEEVLSPLKERLTQLESQRRELFKLRGDVNRLRSENEHLKDMKPGVTPESVESEEPELIDPGPVTTYHGQFNADIRPGETVVAGGWPVGLDRKGYLFVSADVVESENGEVVVIRSRIVDGSEEFSNDLNLGDATGDLSEISPSEVLDSDSLSEYLDSVGDGGEVNLIGSPAVSTLNGRQASISTGHQLEIDGELHRVGTTLSILPEIQTDGSTVRLAVESEWTLPSFMESEGP